MKKIVFLVVLTCTLVILVYLFKADAAHLQISSKSTDEDTTEQQELKRLQKEYTTYRDRSHQIMDFIDLTDLPAIDPVFGSNATCRSIEVNDKLNHLIPSGHRLKKISDCRNKSDTDDASVIQVETVSESKVPVRQYFINDGRNYDKIISTIEVAKLLKNSPREVSCEFAGSINQTVLTYFTLCTVKKDLYWQAKTDKILLVSEQRGLWVEAPRIVVCAPSYGYCMNRNMIDRLVGYGYATYPQDLVKKFAHMTPDPFDTGMTRAFSVEGDIYLTTPKGTEKLTQGGGNFLPHISPDEKWIVYLSVSSAAPNVKRVSNELEEIGPQSGFADVDYVDIHSMSLDGSNKTVLLPYAPLTRTRISMSDSNLHIEQVRTKSGVDELREVSIDPVSGTLKNAEWRQHLGGGKPVIYLYPETPSNVRVQLLRDITYVVQIPHHGTHGWYVHAQPDGTLIDLQPSQTNCGDINTNRIGSEYAKDACAQNKYPYLYWAGTVQEVLLPPLTHGWYVAKEDLQTFISSKLYEMGFEQNEISDMTEYWVPRLNRLHPVENYFLISFLQTDELNHLIPLKVTPLPDTMIRTFMNYAPLKSKPGATIEPQHLRHTSRKGFVLTEWGGKLEGAE